MFLVASPSRRGVTLVEILIAVTFLAVCAVAILQTVLTADTQGSYGLRRAQVLSALQDRIENVRGAAASGPLTASTATETVPITGFVGPVTIVTTTSAHTDSRTLWDVSTTATWTEESSAGTRNDTATLATMVKD